MSLQIVHESDQNAVLTRLVDIFTDRLVMADYCAANSPANYLTAKRIFQFLTGQRNLEQIVLGKHVVRTVNL